MNEKKFVDWENNLKIALSPSHYLKRGKSTTFKYFSLICSIGKECLRNECVYIIEIMTIAGLVYNY